MSEDTWIEPGHLRIGSYDVFRQIIRGRESWEVVDSTGATVVRRTKLRRAIAWISEQEVTP